MGFRAKLYDFLLIRLFKAPRKLQKNFFLAGNSSYKRAINDPYHGFFGMESHFVSLQR